MDLEESITVASVSKITDDKWETEVHLALTDTAGVEHRFLLDVHTAGTVAAYMAEAVHWMLNLKRLP
jgi:preprotein translocase subunit SecB